MRATEGQLLILLTTPDYLPKHGGLTTHTMNVEKVLKKLGIEYELFHWKDYKDIVAVPQKKLESYSAILNIHSGFHMFMPAYTGRVVNFINGAEILFYSPNFFKRLVKNLLRTKGLRRLQEASTNIFISDFTLQTLIKKGLSPDYSRDLVFNMCVETGHHVYRPKSFNDDNLKFICVARDVPHKNFKGVIKLCEQVALQSQRRVELITVTNREFTSDKISIRSYLNPDNALRDELLSEAHFNLLLSLDHSHKGFFEGFGQIVQEAGCFSTPSIVLSTGGLPESVHDDQTGWVLPNLEEDTIRSWWKSMNEESYRRIADECYGHTLRSHGLDNWARLFQAILA